ncbi:hypothetical protein DLAC_10711 [Tieghemostelium lacteum]|uniref:Cysteine-rich protein 1 n=1 Tax=Tieghemostelium lacteum TaxID=361077 RepID=A0A151Z445_TIELA|nr:hypothetical protein DLAC_10711 [Tieghemostelium lacteum]|eukprot:KYQ88687.1 hypothetical protein DLAC_10711 [Tieghemostelium lacteum]
MSSTCPTCMKAVYFAERVDGINGKKYHRACYKCANCRKTLEVGKNLEHEGKIYCHQCHSQFGISGYGYGFALDSYKGRKQNDVHLVGGSSASYHTPQTSVVTTPTPSSHKPSAIKTTPSYVKPSYSSSSSSVSSDKWNTYSSSSTPSYSSSTGAKKFCTHCGNSVVGANFCSGCGVKV